jgi:hypothetical protein
LNFFLICCEVQENKKNEEKWIELHRPVGHHPAYQFMHNLSLRKGGEKQAEYLE